LLVLSLVILGASVTATTSNIEYVKIKAVAFDNYSTPIELNIMISDKHVYARADEISALFSLDLVTNDGNIVLSNKDAFQLIIFHNNDKNIEYMLGSTLLHCVAPFESTINEHGTWIPFEMSLFLVDSSYIITDSGIHIDAPKQTAVKALMSIMKTGIGYYAFDMINEFGYSNLDFNLKGGASHLVNFFNGILDFDPASWGLAFTQFIGDSSPYDAKYGDMLSTMFCSNSSEELENYIEKIETINNYSDFFEWSLGLTSQSKDMEIDIISNELKDIAKHFENINPPILEYNIKYQQLEKTLLNQKSFSDATAVMGIIGDFATIASYGMKYVNYSDEFTKQDKFLISALKKTLKSLPTDAVIPSSTIGKFQSNIELFENTSLEYSLTKMLQDNWLVIVEDVGEKLGLMSKIVGPQGVAVKAVWNVAKSIEIPFTNGFKINTGLTYADKFELSCYATLFQADTINIYSNNVIEALEGDFTNPDLLFNSVYSAYPK